MSFCHKLRLSYTNILATQCRRPYMFQTVNSVRSNNLSLKYQRFTPSGFKDIRIRNIEVVEKKVEKSYSNWTKNIQLSIDRSINQSINQWHELLCCLVYLLPVSLRAISQRVEAPHHHYTRIQTSVPPPGTSSHCSEHVPERKTTIKRKIS